MKKATVKQTLKSIKKDNPVYYKLMKKFLIALEKANKQGT